MPTFEPGHKKRGGRKPGSQNKATSDLRKAVQSIIDTNWPSIQKDLKLLDPKDRLAFLEKMIAYVLPRPQSIDLKADLTTRVEDLSGKQLSALIDEILKREEE